MARRPTSKPSKSSPAPDKHLDAIKRALTLAGSGDHAAAIAAIGRVLRADPKHANAHRIAAHLHLNARDTDRALYHAERAVALSPQSSQPLTMLGSVLDARGDTDAALAAMRRAVELNPSDIEGLTTLALTLDASDLFDEAAAAHGQALALNPNHAPAGMNAALSYLMTGRARDAVDLMQRLAGLHPRDPHVAERLAYCLNYDDRATRAQTNAAHRRWGQLIESIARPLPPRTPGTPPRLALLSPDLRRHSVTNFLAPLFDHLDRDAISLGCVFTSAHADDVTESLRTKSDFWLDAPGLAPPALANLIRDNDIDIIVELSGLFAGHRLPALALSPAPLQLTWLGYPNTTGLTRVHARLVDSLTDPPDLTDTQPAAAREAEQLTRLDPCFLCYAPPPESPAPAEAAPSTTGQPFTFASFNDIKKISPTTLDTWAVILKRTPGSRLLLKAGPLAAESVRTNLTNAFEARGVDADRLILEHHTPTLADHLAAYTRVDLALDTFPYCGTTTTCEALWMGVPVLTRVGQTHAARVGLSLLTAVGLPDLCTDSADAFIDRALQLATDPDDLRAARHDLRGRVAASPLTDAPAFAARFQSAALSLLSSSSTSA